MDSPKYSPKDSPKNKPSIRKSIGTGIRTGIRTVGSVVSTFRKALHNMRPKRKYVIYNERASNTSYIKEPPNIYGRDFGMKKVDSHHGGKKSSKKTKRNMRKRGTQKRR